MDIEGLAKEDQERILRNLSGEIEPYLRSYRLPPDVHREILQETLITVWRKYHQLEDKSKLLSWAYAIVRSKVYAHGRTKKRTLLRFVSLHEFSEEMEPDKLPVPEALIYYELEQFEDTEAGAMVRKLPYPENVIFELHYRYGERFTEIAETLHMPDSTVRSHHARGLRRLYRMMTELHPELAGKGEHHGKGKTK